MEILEKACYNAEKHAPRHCGAEEVFFMEIIPINQDTWRIEDGFVRFFLLAGRDSALLIDSGASSPEAKALAESLTSLPVTLVNTHGDGDHTAGNGAFSLFYAHPADVVGCGLAAKFPEAEILPLEEGMVFELGGRDVEVIALPGHTAGSVALLDRRDRALYAGDSVQTEHIYMFGAHRSPEAFAASLEKLDAMRDRFDVIYASHGESAVPPEHISRVLKVWGQVQRGELQGNEENMHGSTIISYDGDGCGFFCGV